MKRYLVFDLGLKRTGVALVDDINKVATPLSVINNEINSESFLVDILDFVYEWEPNAFVFGLPIDLKGNKAIAAENVKSNVESLMSKIQILLSNKNIDVPEVFFHDERLSTAQAEKQMITHDVPKENRDKIRDSLAACVIAQSFVDSL